MATSPRRTVKFQKITSPGKTAKKKCFHFSPTPSFRMPREIIEDIQWFEKSLKENHLQITAQTALTKLNTDTTGEYGFKSLDISEAMLEELQSCKIPQTEMDNTNNVTDRDDNYERMADELQQMLPSVIKEFESQGKLDILTKFFHLVETKKFPFRNIAFLLWCDVVEWFQNAETRQMRYSPECLQFFWVGKKLFGGRFIRFMSGKKNSEDILKGLNKIDPGNSHINFACPSESILRSVNPVGEDLPLVYKPGILEPVIKYKAEREDRNNSHVLMLDGKKIKRGTDIDLLGFESEKSLKQKEEEKEINLNSVRQCIEFVTKVQEKTNNVTESDDNDKVAVHEKLIGFVMLFSVLLKQLRELKLKKTTGVTKLKDQGGIDWRKSKYAYAIDMCMTCIWKIDNVIDEIMQVLKCLCKVGAYLKNAGHLFAKSSCIDLNKQENLRMLKEPNQLPKDTDTTNTAIIKQRSEKWYKDRQEKEVTGSYRKYNLSSDRL